MIQQQNPPTPFTSFNRAHQTGRTSAQHHYVVTLLILL